MREAKKGSGDNVPRQGFGDEIPNVPIEMFIVYPPVSTARSAY